MENNRNNQTIDGVGDGRKNKILNPLVGAAVKFFPWLFFGFGAAETGLNRPDYYINNKRKIADFLIGLFFWSLSWLFFYVEIDVLRAVGVALILLFPFVGFFTVRKARKYIWWGIIAPYVSFFILWMLIFIIATLYVAVFGPILF
jgi:hypothetical protein